MALISQPGSDYQIASISLDAGYTRDLILMLTDVHAVLDHLYLDGTQPQITAPAEDYLRESASPYTLPALIDALSEITGQLSRAERQALDGIPPDPPARPPATVKNSPAHADAWLVAAFSQNILDSDPLLAGAEQAAAAALRELPEALVVEFAEDLPLVNVDSGLIEEACGQLLENAAKYSPSGSAISVAVRAEHGRVILSISDQGVGITPDEQQQLGRRSFRSQRHQATIPGSGLGFWIASTFVRANGGTIDISSRGQGQGTKASIALPVPGELTALANE